MEIAKHRAWTAEPAIRVDKRVMCNRTAHSRLREDEVTRTLGAEAVVVDVDVVVGSVNSVSTVTWWGIDHLSALTNSVTPATKPGTGQISVLPETITDFKGGLVRTGCHWVNAWTRCTLIGLTLSSVLNNRTVGLSSNRSNFSSPRHLFNKASRM